MPARPRKSSARITLVLLGAATLAACGENQDTLRRDVYATRDDCLKDWGDELKCEQQPAAGRMGGGHVATIITVPRTIRGSTGRARKPIQPEPSRLRAWAATLLPPATLAAAASAPAQ